MSTFRDTDEKFLLKAYLLKERKNFSFNDDYSNLPDRKLMFQFAT